MTRLIKADDIKYFTEQEEPGEFDYTRRYLIDAMPTVEVPTWIPCSERLPNTVRDYLVTTKDGTVDIDMYCSFGWDDYGDEVVAWMELPEPYEEKEHEIG